VSKFFYLKPIATEGHITIHHPIAPTAVAAKSGRNRSSEEPLGRASAKTARANYLDLDTRRIFAEIKRNTARENAPLHGVNAFTHLNNALETLHRMTDRHARSVRPFALSQLITAKDKKTAIQRIPGFGAAHVAARRRAAREPLGG